MQMYILRLMFASAAFVFAGHAQATLMNVEISGYISGKPAAFASSTAVKVGDTFSLSLIFDDTQQSAAPITANGDLYTVVTQPLSPALLAWTGSMPEEIASFNAPANSRGLSGWGTEQSWFRPLGTSHHNEWRITGGVYTNNADQRGFDIYLVTNYAGDLGYGWWSIGSPVGSGEGFPTIDSGFLDVTGLSITPAIPEPSILVLFLVGLGLVVASSRHQLIGG